MFGLGLVCLLGVFGFVLCFWGFDVLSCCLVGKLGGVFFMCCLWFGNSTLFVFLSCYGWFDDL